MIKNRFKLAKVLFFLTINFLAFNIQAQINKPFNMNMNGIKVGIYNESSKKYIYTDFIPQKNASVSSVKNNNGGISIVVKTDAKEQKYKLEGAPFKVDDKGNIIFTSYMAERFDGKKCKIIFQINVNLTIYVWLFSDDDSEVYFCDTPDIFNYP